MKSKKNKYVDIVKISVKYDEKRGGFNMRVNKCPLKFADTNAPFTKERAEVEVMQALTLMKVYNALNAEEGVADEK